MRIGINKQAALVAIASALMFIPMMEMGASMLKNPDFNVVTIITIGFAIGESIITYCITAKYLLPEKRSTD